MSWVLKRTTLRGGTYRGVLHFDGDVQSTPPSLEALHAGHMLTGLVIEPIENAKGQWMVSLQMPVEMMADDVQTVLIREVGSLEALDTVAVMAGVSSDADVRAELDLVRNEVEILKRAVRRIAREQA